MQSLLQARIVALNASYFLKAGGHFVISIKVGLLFSDYQLFAKQRFAIFRKDVIIL